MTSAEITSLLRFTNGNVEQVSEILKGLDIKGPLAGPRKKRRRTGNKTEEGSSEDEDPTLRPSAVDKRVLEFLMEYTSTRDYTDVRTFGISGSRRDPFPNLPSQIRFFVNLRDLRIEETAIRSLPPEIGTLSKLENFECVRNGQLTQLPPEIGDLSRLRLLNCYDNQLTSLPPEIGDLSQLRELNCGFNQLTSLPPQIGRLSQLRVFSCSKNQLTSLPEEIANLKQLVYLSCSKNLLTKLPEEIGELTRLRSLACDNNRLTVLPKTIGKMEALQVLSCQSNRLTSLPAEISLIPSLNTVVAYENPFYRLPLSLGRDGRMNFGGYGITMYAPQGIRKEEDMIKYLDMRNIKGVYTPDDLTRLMDHLADLDAAFKVDLTEIRDLYQKERTDFQQAARTFFLSNDRNLAPLEKQLADLERQLEANTLRGEALEFIQRKQAETVQELPMDEKKKALRSFVFGNIPISDMYVLMPRGPAESVVDRLWDDLRGSYVVLEKDQDENVLGLVVEVLKRDQDKNA